MGKAYRKIRAGLQDALHHAKVQNAVMDWVAFELPASVQAHVTPDMTARLIDSICGTGTNVVMLKPKPTNETY